MNEWCMLNVCVVWNDTTQAAGWGGVLSLSLSLFVVRLSTTLSLFVSRRPAISFHISTGSFHFIFLFLTFSRLYLFYFKGTRICCNFWTRWFPINIRVSFISGLWIELLRTKEMKTNEHEKRSSWRRQLTVFRFPIWTRLYREGGEGRTKAMIVLYIVLQLSSSSSSSSS